MWQPVRGPLYRSLGYGVEAGGPLGQITQALGVVDPGIFNEG